MARPITEQFEIEPGLSFYAAAAKSVADAEARDAALPLALRRGALPRDHADSLNRVYFLRSASQDVEYVPSWEAMREIIHMKYEPNLNQE